VRAILPTGTVTFLLSDRREPATYGSVPEALAAAAELRRAEPEARIAIDAGPARVSDDGHYTGATVRRCARLLEVAAPGQTLLLAHAAAQADAELADLGLHRLRDLAPAERVFALERADAPLESLDAAPHNLPVQLTSFVGREAELAEVHELLAAARLVTLTGAGGTGKTRLALQAAAEQAGRWRDGVWWVELAGADSVAEAVAAAAGVLVAEDALRSLTGQLAARRLLLGLDNCEHVLDAAAEVAAALLRECPEVTVLATSREPLGVPGETVWRMPPLSEDEALALFLDRGSQVRPWFTLDRSNELAVRRMCERLDGMPLALELAAAWLGTLTPQQIEEGLHDRFALLVRGPRGVPERQQTLAASIDWSYDLLAEGDRSVLRRLSVFAGGFTLEAAQAVCGPDVLTSLGRLVDKSLVVAEGPRYRLLETIREYAAERLAEAGEEDEARDQHLDHMLSFVEAAEAELARDKDAWRARMEAEHENLRAALDRGLAAADAERARRLAAGLPWLWHLHGHGQEGLGYLARALRDGDRSVLQGRLLIGLALVADTTRPLDLELDVAQQALAIADEHGDRELRAMALAIAAVGAFYTDLDAGWETALAAEEASAGFPRYASRGLRGIILHLRDRHEEAEALLAPATDELLAHGDRGIAATVLGFRAVGALATGELGRARELAERGVATADPLGDYHRVGTARSVLALVLGAGGDVNGAFGVVGPVIRLAEEPDAFLPVMSRVVGTLHLWRGEPDEAVRWLERDSGPDHYLTAQALPPLAEALRALGRGEEAKAAAERAAALARSLGMPGALADALEQQGEHQEALALRAEHGLRPAQVRSLEALAAELGDERGMRLRGAAARAREELGLPPAAGPAGDPEYAAGAQLTLAEAVAYARRSRGPRDRPPGGLAGLTPTELSVVRLVVQGHSNPEIGARLFMSRSTVKTHLSHVYAKLGVANRTELAALAGEHLAE
jgi:predicted ATPase/DNA-binding CsgD family transcriptional regulator